MFTGSIKISELDNLGIVLTQDFFPLVESSSLTTFRVSIQTLNGWFSVSGSCLTASWASRSFSSVSSSWASSSIYSIYGVSASFASASISSSFSPFAIRSITATSSSFASSSISSSYLYGSGSGNFSGSFIGQMTGSLTGSLTGSASYALNALSSSYAVTSSYAIAVFDTVPIGTIMAFASNIAPNNWLECNGLILSTASFSSLYNAIQTTSSTAVFGYLCDSFGNSNGVGPYSKLPNMRGEFLRGWDHGRNTDVGRNLADFQLDAFQGHWHQLYATQFNSIGGGGVTMDINWINGNNVPGATDSVRAAISDGPDGGPRIASETRPRNVAMMYCIKYSNASNFMVLGTTIAGDVVGALSASTVVKSSRSPS